MDAEAAYQLIHDELALDGTPALNLASFVQTWMPRQADKLMMENISKNLIDQDEYPMTRKSLLRSLRSVTYGRHQQRSFTPAASPCSQTFGMRLRLNRPLARPPPGRPRPSSSEVSR